ncbi:MAG: FAD-binding oxidoreductase [Terriglobia bacterium]
MPKVNAVPEHDTRPLSSLTALMGEESISTDPTVCASFAVDGLLPQCVVYPRSAEDVAAILAKSRKEGLAVIPCSNATKLHIGNIPRRYDLAMCLKGMNRVPHYEPADLTASVEPGMEFGRFQELLGRDGLWLPLDPAGGDRGSLGGIVATNATGPLRLKYGAPRDMVVGLKIATTEGRIVKTGGRVVKNVAGYDLAKLITGSFGTLGAIVEISFKLFSLPARRVTWAVRIQSVDAARELRRRVLNSPLFPMRMVLLDGLAMSCVNGPAANKIPREALEVWIEFGGTERVIQRCGKSLEELTKRMGSTSRLLDNSFTEAAWNRVCNFSAVAASFFGGGVSLKAVLPVAASEGFLMRIYEEAEKRGVSAACICHNGVIHGCLARANGEAAALVALLREIGTGEGGTVIVELGSPDLKRQVDVWGLPGDDFDVMRKLKEVWDPGATLSPGRFLGGL